MSHLPVSSAKFLSAKIDRQFLSNSVKLNHLVTCDLFSFKLAFGRKRRRSVVGTFENHHLGNRNLYNLQAIYVTKCKLQNNLDVKNRY